MRPPQCAMVAIFLSLRQLRLAPRSPSYVRSVQACLIKSRVLQIRTSAIVPTLLPRCKPRGQRAERKRGAGEDAHRAAQSLARLVGPLGPPQERLARAGARHERWRQLRGARASWQASRCDAPAFTLLCCIKGYPEWKLRASCRWASAGSCLQRQCCLCSYCTVLLCCRPMGVMCSPCEAPSTKAILVLQRGRAWRRSRALCGCPP